MSPGWLFQDELEDTPFDSLGHPVLRVRHSPRHLDQRRFTAFFIQVPEPVEAVAGKPHDSTSLADAAELLRQLEHADLVTDDLLVPRHRRRLLASILNVYARRRHPHHRSLSDLIRIQFRPWIGSLRRLKQRRSRASLGRQRCSFSRPHPLSRSRAAEHPMVEASVRATRFLRRHQRYFASIRHPAAQRKHPPVSLATLPLR